MGIYSIGVFHDDNLVNLERGMGHIHNEHRKGGSSAKRLARRTEEQKKAFFEKD